MALNAPADGRDWDLADVKQTLWLTRPDIRELCASDPALFETWISHVARADYAGLAAFGVAPDPAVLGETLYPEDRTDGPALTRFMVNIHACRPDLQQAFDLDSVAGRRGLVDWFFLNAARELKLGPLITGAQQQQLMRPLAGYRPPAQPGWRGRVSALLSRLPGSTRLSELPPLPWILCRILPRRPDLVRAFDLHTARGREGLLRWFERSGRAEYGLTGEPGGLPHPPEPPAPTFGVNLVGYARGQLGIGEDVRMAALACESAGIPFSIYNIEPGADVAQNDNSADQHLSDQLPYPVNIFCTTGVETARLAASDGMRLFAGRYCIGYWPWELPRWPEAWQHAYKLVDEVWASTRFAQAAFEHNSPVPVRCMPMAVETGPVAEVGRKRFELPEDAFLFVFAFDFLSSMQRKNPQACVEAFQRAFPPAKSPKSGDSGDSGDSGESGVGLVVKVMRPAEDNPDWQQLLQQAQQDPRIHIVDEVLDRPEVIALFKACDCFVSLHRSEGFGRGLAEAMLLEVPVIATGWSGNADFCTPETAALVDYRLVPLAPGDYPYGEGQEWAEADVGQASEQMRRIYQDRAYRERLVEQAKALCQARHSAQAVGRHYRQTLEGDITPARQNHNTP